MNKIEVNDAFKQHNESRVTPKYILNILVCESSSNMNLMKNEKWQHLKVTIKDIHTVESVYLVFNISLKSY